MKHKEKNQVLPPHQKNGKKLEKINNKKITKNQENFQKTEKGLKKEKNNLFKFSCIA